MEQMQETLVASSVEAELISMDHARALLTTEDESVKDNQTAVKEGSKESRKLPPKQQPGIIDTIDRAKTGVNLALQEVLEALKVQKLNVMQVKQW